MNEQINAIEEAFTRFRDLCVGLTQSEQNSKRSVAELEYENMSLGNTLKLLSQEKQELQRQVENHKQESERMKDARDAVFRKLGNAHRVIRDLINEVERLQVANGLQPTIQSKAEESEEMHQIIREALVQNLSCSPRSTDSNRSPLQDSSLLRREVPPCEISESGSLNGHHRGTAEGQSKASSHSLSHSPSPEASGESTNESECSSVSLSSVNVDDEERWSIHFGNHPPGVSNMSFGPVTYERLLQHPAVAIEDTEKLKQLEDARDLCLRLHLTSDLLFLNDPILLEERAKGIKKTYVLDWGTAEANALLTGFIRSREDIVLHTFIFPEKKKWYYVGGFTWQVADHLHAIWPSLGKTSKNKVLAKLCERSSDYHEGDVGMKLDDGSLSQICLEISSDGLWTASRDFAMRMGYSDDISVKLEAQN